MSLPSRKVSDESLGRDETSFIRLTTNNVFSQVTVNFINNNNIIIMMMTTRKMTKVMKMTTVIIISLLSGYKTYMLQMISLRMGIV